ncbi:MAG TPA: SurA N-terminal domain-containing protein [Mesorhizobium sp.]|jgi:peptidyl-prolyl cis-trans isomerase D|nr:SurA N-terminal domain-containing protein [Mesorhizobium sp.]
MLETLRKAAGTWVAKILLGLLVLSFAVWGISSSMMVGPSGTAVVTAGDTEVSPLDFRLAYTRQVNFLSQQLGQPITTEQAQAFGVTDQVLAQLVAGAVLDEQARELDLGVSRDRLAALTAEDPSFQDAGGRFDPNRFNYVLQQIGMRAEDYLRNREQAAVREQIVDAVAQGARAPDAFLNALSLYRGEDRTVEYLVLPPTLLGAVEEPTQEGLTAFFEERKANYAAPEYRKIAHVKLEAEDIADEAAISEEQVRQDYETNKAKFTTPETRTIEQVVFDTPEAAQAALTAIRGGATFEEVVAGQGKTLTDALLGTFSRDQLPDRAVVDAAFALQPGQVSDVVQGQFGPVLLRVTNVAPEVVRPFEEVAPQIRRDLALVEANRVLLDVQDSYEDARAGGDTLREAAAKLKLPVVEVEAVDRAGLRPDGTVVEGIPESAEVLRAAFEAEPNIENPPVGTASGGSVFFEVEGVTPARDRTLDEVRDRVVADWKAEETRQRLAARASELEKRIRDGAATLDQIAAELQLEKQVKRGLKRGANDGDLGASGTDAAFAVPQGGVGVTPAPSGEAQILFRVTEAFAPAAAGPDAIPQEERERLGEGFGNGLIDQLVDRLQNEYEVTVDPAAAQRALNF